MPAPRDELQRQQHQCQQRPESSISARNAAHPAQWNPRCIGINDSRAINNPRIWINARQTRRRRSLVGAEKVAERGECQTTVKISASSRRPQSCSRAEPLIDPAQFLPAAPRRAIQRLMNAAAASGSRTGGNPAPDPMRLGAMISCIRGIDPPARRPGSCKAAIGAGACRRRQHSASSACRRVQRRSRS